MNTALDVQPGYAQLQVPFLFGNPYALKSGELGDNERDKEGGDLSPARVEGTPRLEEAESDLDGRTPPIDCGMYLASGASVWAVFIAVSGG